MKLKNNPQSSTVQMASLNICRGMYTKENELGDIFEELGLDCLFLQEVDIRDYDTKKPFSIPGARTFTHKGDKIRTMTLVRMEKIQSAEIDEDLMSDRPEVWVNVTLKGGVKLKLGNVYREWSERQREHISQLEKTIERLSDFHGKAVVAGDFNLDFERCLDGKYQHHKMANNFKTSAEASGFSVLGFGQTFAREKAGKKISSSLDWLLTNQPEAIIQRKKESRGISDHDMICWSVGFQEGASSVEKRSIRNIKRMNRSTFLNTLASMPWEQLADMDVHKQAEALVKFLKTSLDIHAPLRIIKVKPKPAPKPSEHLKDMRRQRDKARGRNQTAQYKKLRNLCVREGKKEKIQHYEKQLLEDPNKCWRIISDLSGGKKEVVAIEKDGQRLSMREAAAEFNQFFLRKVEKTKASIPKVSGDILMGARQVAERLCLKAEALKLKTVSEKQVGMSISRMKSSQCPDIDGISPEILKIAKPVIVVPLTWIINSVIRTATVPEVWKNARIVPLHKKKSKTDLNNYRPVSILPTPSKVLEDVIKEQLEAYFEGKGIIPESQHGFRKGRSTITAIATAVHDWKQAKQEGKEVGALFFDLSAAFDLVCPDLLDSKLKIYGADHHCRKLLMSYMKGRKQNVSYGGEESDSASVRFGSPQGSVLSPLLFLILTSDLPEWLDSVGVVTYADDTTVYAIGETREEVLQSLEVASQALLSFMAASGMAANKEKTKFIMFGKKGGTVMDVDGFKLEETEGEALLGVKISKSLGWKIHVEELESELKKRIGLLNRLKNKLPKHIMAKLVQPVFTSKLTYALEIIGSPSINGMSQEAFLKRLQILQNRASRVALGVAPKHRIPSSKLLAQTNQTSVFQMSFRAVATAAWKQLAPCNNMKTFVKDRLKTWSGRCSRFNQCGKWPSQGVRGSLFTSMVSVWNYLPEDIKTSKTLLLAKRKIRNFVAENII